MTINNGWQLYSQAGAPGEGTQWGIKFRPGYIAWMGRDEAVEIMGLRSLVVDQQAMMVDIEKEITAKDAMIKELEENNHYLRERWQGQSQTIIDLTTQKQKLEASIRRLGSLAFMGNKPLDQIIAHFIAWGQSNHEYTERLVAAFLKERIKRYEEWGGQCFDMDCKCPDSFEECSGCKLYEKASAALEEIRRGADQ